MLSLLRNLSCHWRIARTVQARGISERANRIERVQLVGVHRLSLGGNSVNGLGGRSTGNFLRQFCSHLNNTKIRLNEVPDGELTRGLGAQIGGNLP
jgi:hypothetical protein